MRSIISLVVLILWMVGCQNKSQHIEIMVPVEKIDSAKIEYIMGHFEPSEHEDFVLIPTEYASREGLYLRKETLLDYIRMHNHAAVDGISFTIRSATRNFEYQKGIWERKWTGQTILSDGTSAAEIEAEAERASKILLYSSMPGTSRHHWGTDIDLNSFDNSYFETGQGLLEYQWLLEHASEYGFCQSYTDKSGGRTGYEEEKWHWTYTPIITELTVYAQQFLKDDMIKGFMGAETAPDIAVVKNYVLGIDQNCFNH